MTPWQPSVLKKPHYGSANYTGGFQSLTSPRVTYWTLYSFCIWEAKILPGQYYYCLSFPINFRKKDVHLGLLKSLDTKFGKKLLSEKFGKRKLMFTNNRIQQLGTMCSRLAHLQSTSGVMESQLLGLRLRNPCSACAGPIPFLILPECELKWKENERFIL